MTENRTPSVTVAPTLSSGFFIGIEAPTDEGSIEFEE
jgi:hypothetical protein